MNQIIPTIIVLAIVGGIVAWKLSNKKRFKKAKDKINEEVNEFTVSEQRVVNMCNELFGNPKVDVIVVRSPKQEILHYAGQTWAQTAEPATAKAFYSNKHKSIFIRRFSLHDGHTTPLLEFMKLYIHEMNHFRGYDHGEEMKQRDQEQIEVAGDEMLLRNIV